MRQFIIIGNSAAGIAAVEAIRLRDKDSKIIVISDEDYPVYCRCLISYYLAKEVKGDKIFYRPDNFYKENNVELLLNKKVSRVDPKKSRIVCEDKTALSYDSLLISTGASPKFPSTTGIKKTGVFGFRTLKDAKEIEGQVPVTKTACILGGGLVGLKSLEAFIARRREVHLVVSSGRILSQMLDQTASDLLLEALGKSGVKVYLQRDVRAFSGGDRLKAAELSDGTIVPCCLAVIGKGVTPNVGLMEGTGCAAHQGLLVDSSMATSLEGVYAAGDVAEPPNLLGDGVTAIWPMAVEGGRTAGSNMAGEPAVFQGALRMNSIEFMGTKVISAGEWRGGQVLHAVRDGGTIYRKLSHAEGRLRGFILAGDVRCAGVLTALIRNRTEVSLPVLEEGLDRGFSYWPRLRSLQGQVLG